MTLVPGDHGVFDVSVNGDLVFSRTTAGRYPEIAELREAIKKRLD